MTTEQLALARDRVVDFFRLQRSLPAVLTRGRFHLLVNHARVLVRDLRVAFEKRPR